MDNRKKRIQLLAQKNRGKLEIPGFVANLSGILGEEISESNLLSLEDTEMVLDSFRSGYQSAIRMDDVSYRRFFRSDESEQVFRFAECLSRRLPCESVSFVTKLSKNCGAVKTQLTVVLTRAAPLIQFDGDSLAVLSENQKQGILIDYNSDDPEEMYEVVVWGDKWTAEAYICEQYTG